MLPEGIKLILGVVARTDVIKYEELARFLLSFGGSKQFGWYKRIFLLKLVVWFAYNKTNSEEMAFFSDQFLRGVLFFAVGGISSVAILKIWENSESVLREIRRRFDSNETRQPEEHDERFDWEGKSSVSYENILSKPNRIMVISEKLNDTHNQWLFRQQRTQNVSTTETVKADRVDILLCRRYLYRHFSVLSFFS